tara:strand:- start:679 stop:1053 length:375 start_codon:yes stop_codon:yes gene_type:complete
MSRNIHFINFSVSQYGECMSVEFNEFEQDALRNVVTNVEEFHVDYRKNISQSKYVFEVKPGQTWYDWKKEEADSPIPEKLVGMWMMEDARCLQYDNLEDCIRSDSWVKCEKTTVETYEYQPIED